MWLVEYICVVEAFYKGFEAGGHGGGRVGVDDENTEGWHFGLRKGACNYRVVPLASGLW